MTEDVPNRMDVGKTAAFPSEQVCSLSPIEIVIFYSKDDLMTGYILTAADPWRVSASLPKINSTSTVEVFSRIVRRKRSAIPKWKS